VNQHVAIIRAKAGVPPRFIHMHLLRPDIKSYLLGLNAGASREAITKAHIESLTVLTPGPQLLAAFQTATDPLFRQVQRFAQQMRVLGELRDTLLPKLLSGELAVTTPIESAGDM
jgi:type I restriction enzyme S subunit